MQPRRTADEGGRRTVSRQGAGAPRRDRRPGRCKGPPPNHHLSPQHRDLPPPSVFVPSHGNNSRAGMVGYPRPAHRSPCLRTDVWCAAARQTDGVGQRRGGEETNIRNFPSSFFPKEEFFFPYRDLLVAVSWRSFGVMLALWWRYGGVIGVIGVLAFMALMNFQICLLLGAFESQAQPAIFCCKFCARWGNIREKSTTITDESANSHVQTFADELRTS